jgi:NitT/TauT family transport system substrate-binding protein
MLVSAGSALVTAGFQRRPATAQTAPIPVRFALIGSGGQDETAYVIQQSGLDKKYGLALSVTDIAAPGQQYNVLRGDGVDVITGNFFDLLRQRKARLGLRGFRGFQGLSNLVVVKPDSPIKQFVELKGKRIGTFGNTSPDWLIIRAAGKTAYNIDLEKDAELVPGGPALLNQLLAKGQIDAALQFGSLALAPIAQGLQRAVVRLPPLMATAGFNPHCFYLLWSVSEKWLSTYPGAIDRVNSMLEDAYAKLNSNDTVWPALAQQVGIADPLLISAYRNQERRVDNPPYAASLIEPTQKLVDAIVAIVGSDAVGVSQVDPAGFVFPGRSRPV